MTEHYWQAQGTRRPRSALLSYLLVGLVGALIGGLLVIAVAPTYLADRMGAVNPPGGSGTGTGLPGPSGGGAGGAGGAGGGVGGAPAQSGTVIYAAEAVTPTVVGITNRATGYDMFRRPYTQQSSGSGVVFRQDGYILTNHHVVEGATELLVNLADGRVLPGTIIGTDAFSDLAVIKVEATGLPVAAFGNSDVLRVGELAVAIGNPVGLEFVRTVTAGIISGLNRRVQQGERQLLLIQTDAAINPGNSGGPLVNGAGEVVGINTLKYAAQGIEGMSFAIPINTARPIVTELMANGRIVRPWLGVRIVERADAARYGVTVERGVLIVETIARGPAANAGLRAGDIILTVGGQDVHTVAELTTAVQTMKVGDRVPVVVLRGGSQQTVYVILAEMRVQ
jgi:serine protease Do